MAGEHDARAPGWRQQRAPNDAEIERAAEPGYAVQRATASARQRRGCRRCAAARQAHSSSAGKGSHACRGPSEPAARWCGASAGAVHEPHRDLRAPARIRAGVRVHRGGAPLAGPPAHSRARIERGVPAECTDEPSAIGRAGEVPPAGLDRRKPDRLKQVLCLRPPTGGSLSLRQELGDYAWRHVALRIHKVFCHPRKRTPRTGAQRRQAGGLGCSAAVLDMVHQH